MKPRINTVPADNQSKHADVIRFLGKEDAPHKILVLGNSITRHGPSAEIDWHFDWGMAASAPERDYVHRLYAMLTEYGKEPFMMIRQASHWERNFQNPACLAEYERERAFGADIVVFRLGENVGKKDFPALKDAALTLVDYVAPVGAFVIFTTGFWKNAERDEALRCAAETRGSPCVDIACTNDDMMALGLFTHPGVSIHPGDKGMEMIARKLFETMVAEYFER